MGAMYAYDTPQMGLVAIDIRSKNSEKSKQ